MDILTVMDKINAIQENISITDPVTGNLLAVKRVFKYWPDGSMQLSKGDTPAFFNTWTAPEVSYRSAVLIGTFTVDMRLVVYDADTDKAADRASAFYPQIVAAFEANIKLDGYGPATVLTLRGAEPTLAVFKYGDGGFAGLDLFLDVNINRRATIGA